MTPTEAGQILTLLHAAFPTFPLADDTSALWVGELQNVAFDDGRQAAQQIIRGEDWFPSVAKFLAAANELAAAKWAKDRNRWEAEHSALRETCTACNASGWLHSEDFLVVKHCPECNPPYPVGKPVPPVPPPAEEPMWIAKGLPA